MGGYDLYGRYYPNMNDAINAEMAQCASIDADIAYREMEDMKQQMSKQQQLNEEINYLWQYIKILEDRIALLEENNNSYNR